MSVLIAFIGVVLGAGASVFGQFLAHRLTSERERAADFTATLDRAISSLVAGEHAVQQFIAKAGTGAPPPIVQEAADRVSAQEIDMRAAFISLRVRLGNEDEMVLALNRAEDHFREAYTATEPALTQGLIGPDAVAPALEAVAAFKDACDVALSIAHARFGGGAARKTAVAQHPA